MKLDSFFICKEVFNAYQIGGLFEMMLRVNYSSSLNKGGVSVCACGCHYKAK